MLQWLRIVVALDDDPSSILSIHVATHTMNINPFIKDLMLSVDYFGQHSMHWCIYIQGGKTSLCIKYNKYCIEDFCIYTHKEIWSVIHICLVFMWFEYQGIYCFIK